MSTTLSGQPRKLDAVLAAMRDGDWRRALSLAARFPRLGEHRAAITRAHGACTNPGFYRQLGKDPDQLIEAGRRALVERYGAPAGPPGAPGLHVT